MMHYFCRDFHADLYPDTSGYITELTAAQWIEGKNIPLAKISLDPAKREKGEEPITVIVISVFSIILLLGVCIILVCLSTILGSWKQCVILFGLLY